MSTLEELKNALNLFLAVADEEIPDPANNFVPTMELLANGKFGDNVVFGRKVGSYARDTLDRLLGGGLSRQDVAELAPYMSVQHVLCDHEGPIESDYQGPSMVHDFMGHICFGPFVFRGLVYYKTFDSRRIV